MLQHSRPNYLASYIAHYYCAQKWLILSCLDIAPIILWHTTAINYLLYSALYIRQYSDKFSSFILRLFCQTAALLQSLCSAIEYDKNLYITYIAHQFYSQEQSYIIVPYDGHKKAINLLRTETQINFFVNQLCLVQQYFPRRSETPFINSGKKFNTKIQTPLFCLYEISYQRWQLFSGSLFIALIKLIRNLINTVQDLIHNFSHLEFYRHLIQ